MNNNFEKNVKIKYENLQPLDIVICGGVGFLGFLIRLFTGKGKVDKFVSTHAGIIYDSNGVKYIAEMKPEGLQINSLEEYNRKNKRHFIIDIFRHSGVDQNMIDQGIKGIAKDRLETKQYDFKGDANFVFGNVKGSEEAYFCSEYVAEVFLKVVSIAIPGTGETGGVHGVSPADIQRWSEKACRRVDWF